MKRLILTSMLLLTSLAGCSTEWQWPIEGVTMMKIRMSGITVHPWLLVVILVFVVLVMKVRSLIRAASKDERGPK